MFACTGTAVLNLLTHDLGDLGHVLGQGNDHLQVLVGQTQTAADVLKLAGTCRVLTAGHTGGEVIADDDGDVGVLVDGVKQAGHA